jgi:DNA-binding MarR family transcriptional regulator
VVTLPEARAVSAAAVPEVVDEMTVAAVRDIMNASDALRNACARHYGMPQSDVLALSHLTAYGSMTASELAEMLRLTGASVTSVADRLERGGLARRVPHAFDRRRVVVEVTVEGRARITTMRTMITQAMAGLFDPALVATVLTEVAARLQAQVADVGPTLDRLAVSGD